LTVGKAARQTVIERFNRERLGTELMSVYSRLITGSKN
jgi:hypothetical protein